MLLQSLEGNWKGGGEAYTLQELSGFFLFIFSSLPANKIQDKAFMTAKWSMNDTNKDT